MHRRIFAAAIGFAAGVGVAGAQQFSSPVVAEQAAHISSPFGQRASGSFHVGADAAAAPGSEVRAPAGGEVRAVHEPGAPEGYHGQVVETDHGAAGRTRFSNLYGVTLAPGAHIEAGAVIGRIAVNEAPHVHVELWRDVVAHDPALSMSLIAGR